MVPDGLGVKAKQKNIFCQEKKENILLTFKCLTGIFTEYHY
jgi:hypothetical protein